MDKKTILFNNIRKHIKNVEVYNMLTTSYLNDTYTVFLEKVYEEQYKILEELNTSTEILSKEIKLMINKMNTIAIDISNDSVEQIMKINELIYKNKYLEDELNWYKRNFNSQIYLKKNFIKVN